VEAAQKHKEEWNQIQDPDIDHHSDSYFIFDKGDKNTHWRKDSLFDK
jgi:tRNA U34 5-methylaminomethyl-2-thiouridine-forming methyltransferase MnmC